MVSDRALIGLYPGTFDAPTNGHLNLIRRAARLFDTLYVAVAKNTGKSPLLSPAERVALLKAMTRGIRNVRVVAFEGLTVDYARAVGAAAIVRGLRAVSDFEYELQMALLNQQMAPEIETIYLAPDLESSFLSSSMIREIVAMGGDVGQFVPREVEAAIRRKLRSAPAPKRRAGSGARARRERGGGR